MKLDYIDALRGIAILSVIWFHCHLSHFSDPAYPSRWDWLGATGALGVQLFYVLSAFTLFLSHHRRREPGSRAGFFFRRFLRIAPMYYVALGYYLWQATLTYGQPLDAQLRLQAPALLINGLLLHGLSPHYINEIIPGGWSVGVEVLFYGLLPWLTGRITTLNRAILFTVVALLVGYTLSAALLQSPAPRTDPFVRVYLFQWLPYQLPVFGCGIIAYFLVFSTQKYVSRNVAMLAALAVSVLVVSKVGGKSAQIILPQTLPLGAGMGFVALIFLLARHPIRLLVNPLTRYVGQVSYSAYLLHFGVLYWLDKWLPQQLIPVSGTATNILNFNLKFMFVVLVTVLVSSVTYRLIELPMQQLGKRFRQLRSGAESGSLSMTN